MGPVTVGIKSNASQKAITQASKPNFCQVSEIFMKDADGKIEVLNGWFLLGSEVCSGTRTYLQKSKGKSKLRRGFDYGDLSHYLKTLSLHLKR